ncbi:MAG TPA: hypothetical protein VJH03_12445 [Blastocatellia bacterium]|nr:hypothetical protein [Blastocatellia bacterium]
MALDQVYGAIAYYLDHQDEIDEYIRQGQVDYEAMQEASRKADPMFYQKMAGRRRQMKTSV